MNVTVALADAPCREFPAPESSLAMTHTFSNAPLAIVLFGVRTVVAEPDAVPSVTFVAVVVPDEHEPVRFPAATVPAFEDVEPATTVQRRPTASGAPVFQAFAV